MAKSLHELFLARSGAEDLLPRSDLWLVAVAMTIVGVGVVMIGSASVGVAERMTGDSTFFLLRQIAYVLVGGLLALVVWQVPLRVVERMGPLLLIVALALLVVLFIPGIGKSVNGSTRWLALGPINFQASEFAKLAMIIYLAGYLLRRGDEVREHIIGFIKPMLLLVPFALLLLLEPDFGATAVIVATSVGMMFLAGVRIWIFGVLVSGLMGAMALLAVASPYRMERLTTFLNPWADPFNSGFQLTQALIAFGRGEWFGVGLGGSVQKLFYLPEAHTDFVYAVLAEELGMVGASVVVLLFVLLVGRIFHIGRRAELAGERFGAHICYGVGIWIALQAFINMGVNMGLLPTKGLTLPLMSYGGSSIVIMAIAVALVMRVHAETPLSGASSGEARR